MHTESGQREKDGEVSLGFWETAKEILYAGKAAGESYLAGREALLPLQGKFAGFGVIRGQWLTGQHL